MRYSPINPELFIHNRLALWNAMKPASVAVFHSNDLFPTSADGTMPFVQHSDIFYLTGIDQEESILLVNTCAQDDDDKFALFIKETSQQIAIWEGEKLSKEQAAQLSGIKKIYWLSSFEQIFRETAFNATHIYLNTNEHRRASVETQTRDDRFIKWCQAAFPLHHYERLSPIMHKLRAIKSPIEVALISKAIEIAEKAFRRILKYVKRDVWEYQIEAELLHEIMQHGSRRFAFDTIIASGSDSCVLHYIKNDKRCKAGEIVLIDFGAEYANYHSDITRVLPISGRFSSRQKEIYNAVLRMQRAAMQLLKPGMTFKEIRKEMGYIAEKELVDLGLISLHDLKSQRSDAPLYQRYFMHGVSHHLGLNVHDYGDMMRPLEAGMVLTCEPGIYVREEGIGIRLENDLLITQDGTLDLAAQIPIEAEAIEELMNTR